MIEVILIAGIVIVGGIVFLLGTNENIVIKKQRMLFAQEKLNIAEKKFLQGKIKKKVFDDLKFNLQYEIVLNKLLIIKIKKEEASIKPKLEKLFKRLNKKTKHKKSSLSRLLTEADIIKKQLNVVDSMFMKRQVSEEVYDRIAQEKENQLLGIEADILKTIKEN